MRRCAGRRALAALLALAAASARAESELALPVPDAGTFRGAILDEAGRVLGVNVIENAPGAAGGYHLRSEARLDGLPGNLLEAALEPIPGGDGRLRAVWQRTRMPTSEGDLVELFVDHRNARARCERAGEAPREIALAPPDLVANVAMSLALRPLAAGEVESVRFQMVLCEGWRSIVGVEARAENRAATGAPVEMRLGFDVGSALASLLLRPFLPQFRIWMRPEPPNEWVAHRLPLHPGGPDVAIVREGRRSGAVPAGPLNAPRCPARCRMALSAGGPMRLLVLALALLLAPVLAHAQGYPVGVGFAVYKEAAKIKGCDSAKVADALALQVFSDGSFLTSTGAGDFTGFLTPLDSAGRVWGLTFDANSASDYFDYLDFVATLLCGTPVTVLDAAGLVVLKMSKDRTQFSFELKVVALGTSAFGDSIGKHQMKGKGDFAPAGPVAAPSGPGFSMVWLP
jgi:hypothetical protein